MVIKLYGTSSPYSTCTRRAAHIFKECNIPYELVELDVSGGALQSESYLENFQPFGQFPVMEDEDGFRLYESRAIAKYIATKADSSLYPVSDPKKFALAEQAASVEASNFDTFAYEITIEKVVKPAYYKTEGDEVRATELTKKLDANLQAYEKILAKQKYLAGDEITLADLFHLTYGTVVFDQLKLGLLDGKPNVTRWWKEISSRPAWLAVKDGA